MRIKTLGVSLALIGALATGGGALAQSGPVVTLKSFDGFTQLRGELVDFDGQYYTIETRLGTLQVDALQVSCEGEACPSDLLFGQEFAIRGSNTIGATLMPSLIEGYADTLDASLEREIGADPEQRTFRIIHSSGEEMAAIDLEARGSGTSFPALAAGTAAFGMSSRRIRGNEADVLLEAGYADPRDTDNEKVLALDGLLIIVHPDNPVRSISISEAAQVFSGQITNWSELGGLDRPINVYSRDAESGTYDTFESLVLDPFGAELAGNAERFASNADLSDNVSSDLSGIGFTGFAFARAAKVLPIRQECGMLSYPTTFAIKTEEYPLARRLYLYTTEDEMPSHARRILDFAESEEAAPYIEDAGFISLQPEAQGLNEQGQRISYAMTEEDEFSLPLMREMLREFREAQRLSLTFRFTPGSSQLTAQSQRDAEEFAEDIVNGEYAGREIMLVGFTDSIGQFELNQTLAERRAQGVLFTMAEAVSGGDSIGELDDTSIEVRGYGELTPVGCNTTFAGRVANRRVEVWVR